MRFRSKKRAREDCRDRAVLDIFAIEHPACWLCRESWGVQIHHIAGRTGPQRNARCNLAALCPTCHQLFTDNAFAPLNVLESAKHRAVVVCLALKSIHDRAHYDRLTVLRIAGKSEQWITQTEVDWEVADLRKSIPSRYPDWRTL